MNAFEMPEVLAAMHESGQSWREFFRSRSLSMGIYVLKVGHSDLQSPHTEDEAYYIIAGRSRFQCGSEVREVGPGSILYVERSIAHRFIEIREDLTILVFFAPPEGSLKG